MKFLYQNSYFIYFYFKVISCQVIFLARDLVRSYLLNLGKIILTACVILVRLTNLNLNIRHQFNIDYFSVHVNVKVIMASFFKSKSFLWRLNRALFKSNSNNTFLEVEIFHMYNVDTDINRQTRDLVAGMLLQSGLLSNTRKYLRRHICWQSKRFTGKGHLGGEQ